MALDRESYTNNYVYGIRLCKNSIQFVSPYTARKMIEKTKVAEEGKDIVKKSLDEIDKTGVLPDALTYQMTSKYTDKPKTDKLVELLASLSQKGDSTEQVGSGKSGFSKNKKGRKQFYYL